MTPSRPTLPVLLLTVALLAAGCGRLEPLSTEQALDRLAIATSQCVRCRRQRHREPSRRDQPRHRQARSDPAAVRNAVIAIEDERFWHHQGLDLRSITRAAVSNSSPRRTEVPSRADPRSPNSWRRTSTFERPDRTLSRKVAEARVTWQIERQYTKSEILAMYLNTIYLGRGLYGIETAAKSYFGKSASELSVAEGAFLAGLIHEPARYEWTPSDPPDRRGEQIADAKARRNHVIDRMVRLNMLSTSQAAAAKDVAVEVEPASEEEWKHPYFVDHVLRQLGVLGSNRLDPRFDFLGTTPGERAGNVYVKGLRIFTTLDPVAQAAAEEAVKVLPTDLERLSVAMAAIEPGNGFVRALVGGRDYYPDCEDVPTDEQPPVCELAKVNLALGNTGGGSGRQPGSSFKPFVLAAALQRGISLHQYFDGTAFEHRYPGGTWKVANYDGSGAGPMTLVEGTARSVNAVFARLEIDGVGEGDALRGSAFVAETARRMGISFPTREQLESRALCRGRYGQEDRCLAADELPPLLWEPRKYRHWTWRPRTGRSPTTACVLSRRSLPASRTRAAASFTEPIPLKAVCSLPASPEEQRTRCVGSYKAGRGRPRPSIARLPARPEHPRPGAMRGSPDSFLSSPPSSGLAIRSRSRVSATNRWFRPTVIREGSSGAAIPRRSGKRSCRERSKEFPSRTSRIHRLPCSVVERFQIRAHLLRRQAWTRRTNKAPPARFPRWSVCPSAARTTGWKLPVSTRTGIEVAILRARQTFTRFLRRAPEEERKHRPARR